MLVLTVRIGEKVIIGNNLATIERLPGNRFEVHTPDSITIISCGEIGEKLKVVDDVFIAVLDGDWRIGIEAPRKIDILREKVWNRQVNKAKEKELPMSWVSNLCEKLLGGSHAKNI